MTSTESNSCPTISAEKLPLVEEMTTKLSEFELRPQPPAETWERIFKLLDFKSLLSVRSTCKRWTQIVDESAAMMQRFGIRFRNFVIDRDFQPTGLIPARSATFADTRISSIEHWWTEIGENLQHLKLNSCQISTPKLLKMLQHTPNLRSLWYSSDYPENCASIEGVRLDKLEQLTVGLFDSAILSIFQQIFTQVKYFQLLPSLRSHDNSKSVSEFLVANKDNLQEVSLDSYFPQVLQLKNLTSLEIGEIDDQTTNKIGDALPELKNFAFILYQSGEWTPTFLNKMRKLEKLSIKYHVYSEINFSELETHNLKQVELRDLSLKHRSFQQFVRYSRQLSHVTMNSCRIGNWSTFFAAIEQMESLEHLEMQSMYCTYGSVSEYFDQLKCLRMRHIEMPSTLLKTFLELCPQLEDLELVNVYSDKLNTIYIDDNIIEVICKKLRLLKKITIKGNIISSEKIDFITKHYHGNSQVKLVFSNII